MIICSAIKFYQKDDEEYPVIMTAKRHADVFEKMFNLGIKYHKDSAIQGFLTDDNHFLDRYEAKHEARRCGQLVVDTGDRALYSEDIWPE